MNHLVTSLVQGSSLNMEHLAIKQRCKISKGLVCHMLWERHPHGWTPFGWSTCYGQGIHIAGLPLAGVHAMGKAPTWLDSLWLEYMLWARHPHSWTPFGWSTCYGQGIHMAGLPLAGVHAMGKASTWLDSLWLEYMLWARHPHGWTPFGWSTLLSAYTGTLTAECSVPVVLSWTAP